MKFELTAAVNFRFAPKAWIIGIAFATNIGFVIGLGPFHLEFWTRKG